MSEKPIERLSYFNGQRLEADDLRLEQEYHLRIQRLLMKSLFSPGVADGFEVSPIEDGKKVVVLPGVALDDLGRAIILVNPIELVPQGRYLCLRYAERKERVQGGECKVKVNGPGTEQQARWGGPGRITSEPDLFWRQAPPLADRRELVIAELTLKEDCTVDKVDSEPRHRAVPAPLASVRPISLEGEKDIDKDNPKIIRFFIKNRRPSSVTLYLKATIFSTLYYREVGSHTHTPSVSGGTHREIVTTLSASGVDSHAHGSAGLNADNKFHDHMVTATVYGSNPSGAIQNFGIMATGPTALFAPGPLPTIFPHPDIVIGSSIKVHDMVGHTHAISGKTGVPIDKATSLHTHPVEIDLANLPTGATGVNVRAGKQLAFFFGLTITVRRGSGTQVDYTESILEQLQRTNASVWSPGGILITSLDGGKGKPLTDNGTGPIRLDLLPGLIFEPDEFVPYEIELSVPGERLPGEGNGGCIQYNLYVE